jgi:hypothetical protein
MLFVLILEEELFGMNFLSSTLLLWNIISFFAVIVMKP